MKSFVKSVNDILDWAFISIMQSDASLKDSLYDGDLGESEALEISLELEEFDNYLFLDNDCKELIDNYGISGLIFTIGFLKLLDTALNLLDDEDYNLIIYDGVTFDFFENGLSEEEISQIVHLIENWDDDLIFNIDGLADFNPSYLNWSDEELEGKDLEVWKKFWEREKDLHLLVQLYISGFNEYILEIFNHTPIRDLIFQLTKRNLLSAFIKKISEMNVSEKYFSSIEVFTNAVFEFVDELGGYTLLDMIDNDSEYFGKIQLFRENSPIRDEFLIELLFSNTKLEKYDKINIYDPCFDNINLLKKSFEIINSRNENCNINFYGKLNFKYSLFDTTKVIMYSFLNQGNIILSLSQDPGIPFKNILLEDIDFIVSEYMKNIYKEIGLLHQFQNRLDYSTKLVILLDEEEFSNNYLTFMALNDNLEAIITLGYVFVLILNSNKLNSRKNKFLLVDYTLLDENFDHDFYHTYSVLLLEPLSPFKYKYKNYAGVDYIKSKYLIDILDVFNNFTNTNFSKIVFNDDAVEDYCLAEPRKFWGRNISYYGDIFEDLTKEYEKAGGISKVLFDLKYYLQNFNYNDLIYDLKRKPYSLFKQKYIGNKQSEIVEEKLDFVPLHSLITLDENQIPCDEIEARKIEYIIDSTHYIFYIKSDKILKKFLIYYLESDKGKDEYYYFAYGFGFESDDMKYLQELRDGKIEEEHIFVGYRPHTYTCPDFFYMRIPLLDIETQKEIIKTYELNEEYYQLVKQRRDHFRKNILDYEKVQKDMEEFNKMEIDTTTGQITKMNTVKRHMFDGLLWPLSISYLNAVHGTHVSNPNEKLDFYLKLFEFITAFIDIILISAIPDEEYVILKEGFWEGISENHNYNVSFGTWTKLYEKLLDKYDEMNFEPKFSNELIESLLNEDIFSIMDEAREIRNEFPGHGASIRESRAKQLIDDLKLKIDVVYEIFSYLTGFKLFYSVKVLELFEDGSNLYEVVSLNGPCDQPIYGEVTFNKRLKNNSLYLNNSIDGDLLELNKHLIKFEEVYEEYVDKKGRKKQRATGRFYLYMFNGFNKKKNKMRIKYKCYQVETDEIRKNVSFDEWKELM